jgi:hypothetical protein
MYYLDYVRSRKRLIVFTSIVGAIILLQVAMLPFSHVGPQHRDIAIGVSSETVRSHALDGIQQLHELGRLVEIPWAFLCAIAAILAIIFSTTGATSLASKNRHLHLEFTRPTSRERSTLVTIGIDVAATAIAFAIGFALLLVPLTVVGWLDRIEPSPATLFVVAFGLGIAYMWYGMVQAITVLMRSGGGTIAGTSWAVFVFLLGLGQLGINDFDRPLVLTIHALNWANPLAHLQTFFADATLSGRQSLVTGSVRDFTIIWSVAFVTLALAVVQRKRMEV